MVSRASLYLCLILPFSTCFAEQKIELKMTTIKANKELPKILYVVPWKDIKRAHASERKLILHSLFGDLYKPVLPTEVNFQD